jgi:hypothetical protein
MNGVRLDRPPRKADYVDLPAGFGTRFSVSVDTEEEFDWSRPHSRDQRATASVEAIPEAHARMRRHGVKPMYLVDHPIATDPVSIAILRPLAEAGECTIGTQLHPWVNPPFDEELSLRNSFVGNLPIELERAKLRVLTEAIAEGFGSRPIVYRAGRYGIGPNTAGLLLEQGYRADVSVRPLFDYRGEGGPDFFRVKPGPYWVGGGDLLEIPLTNAFTGALRGQGRALYRRLERMPLARSLVSRAGLLSRVALTPEGMPAGEVKDAIRRLRRDGVRLFNISFHSPSLQPGHTPYVRTQADLDQFYAWWDELFAFFEGEGIAPASFEDVLAACEQSRRGG